MGLVVHNGHGFTEVSPAAYNFIYVRQHELTDTREVVGEDVPCT